MSRTNKEKRRRLNALDITIVLLVFLVMMGIAGRIILDRRNSSGMEDRTVSFTCTIPADKAERIAVGSVLKDDLGNDVAKVAEILETKLLTKTEGGTVTEYRCVTGNMTVRGYVTKNGVFHSKSGLVLRINTTVSLHNTEQMQFYINDIVKNGQ